MLKRNSKLAWSAGILYHSYCDYREPIKDRGYLLLLLHAHLPYIRYPEHEQHLEEVWLHEAIIESYIPLLNVFEDLLNDKTDFRITLSLTPSLLEMLSDKLLMTRFQEYLDSRIELAERELSRTRSEPGLGRLAEMYHKGFLTTKSLFEDTYQKDLISAFRSIYQSGKVELITSAATMPICLCISLSRTAYGRRSRSGQYIQAVF